MEQFDINIDKGFELLSLRKKILSQERGEKARKGLLNICLFYPNSYKVGISTLALHRIFEITKRVPNTGVTRVFLEGKRLLQVFPLDNQFEIFDSQVLAFFLSYELDYLNAIRALSLLSIPLKSLDRKDSYPLIIAGGPAITNNPEIFNEVLDLIFIGEAEESYQNFLKLFFKFNNKEKILEEANKIDGIYVPAINKKYKRVFYKGFAKDFSKSIFFTKAGEFGDCLLIELTRGCPAKCKFCLTRVIYSPVRFADKDLVKQMIEKTENKKIGLLGASVSYHPYIKEIMEFIVKKDKSFSISSLRVDVLDSDFIDLLFLGGSRTITIAPEAGTERLRKKIDKGISEEYIEKCVLLALKKGFLGIKLYFMIGLPGEQWDDIEGIIEIARKIKNIEKSHKKSFIKKSFTISPFVPKLNTPYSEYMIEDVKILSQKINYLRKSLVQLGIEVHYDHPKTALLEYELSRKDILSWHLK